MRTLLLTLAVALAAAAPASAAVTPVDLGPGYEPSVVVDQAGTAHILFLPALFGPAQYCRLPVRPMLACVVCFLAAACQPIIIGFAGSTGAIAAFELLAGIGVSAGFTLWETTLGREIPPGALSRVTSLDWFSTAGAMPLGFAVVAGVAAALGTRETMLGASLVVLALLLAALAAGDVRRLRTAPAPG